MGQATSFVAALDAKLNKYGCTTVREAALGSGLTAAVAGSRTYFSWKGLVIQSQHMVVQVAETATVADCEKLFDAGFAYGKSRNRVPLLRGMQFGYMVIPVLALSTVPPDLAAYAAARPRKHFALFEFPVVVDLPAGQVHYYKDRAMWGAAFFSDLRDIVEQCVVPSVSA